MQKSRRYLSLRLAAVILAVLTGTAVANHQETTVVLVNLTDSDLRLKNKETDGKWDEQPLDLMTNGATMSCKAHSDKLFEGHYVSLAYTSTRGGSVWFKLDNTWGSGNHAYQENRGVPNLKDAESGEETPLYLNRYGPAAHGDMVVVTWILAWQDLKASGQAPADQINSNLEKSMDALNRSDIGK